VINSEVKAKETPGSGRNSLEGWERVPPVIGDEFEGQEEVISVLVRSILDKRRVVSDSRSLESNSRIREIVQGRPCDRGRC
jgi:hypothetical protein